MIERTAWFERRFTFDLEPAMFAGIVERLRGTPARLAARVDGLAAETRTRHAAQGAWSIQENVGHLGDLEPLWMGRLEETLRGAQRLRPADLTNAKTHQARHDAREMRELLAVFRSQRERYVAALEQLDAQDVLRSAQHPRLEQPMRVIDQAFFVAEHDDHHLASISEILRASA